MAFGGGSSGGVKADINITPLVDVVLVLLIIFMVVTPMLQRGKDVRLPQAKEYEKDKKSADPIVISMTTEKQLYYETNAYSEQQLAEKLKEDILREPTKKILLKGDERLKFGDVRKVLNRLRESGLKGIGLAVEVKDSQ